MLYRLWFTDARGNPLTLAGFKLVEDDPGMDTWSGHLDAVHPRAAGPRRTGRAGREPEVVAAGIITIHLLDFARQLTTFRCDPPARLDALARFGALFAGDLWEVYGPQGREGAG